jgi:hypothetical protein
MLRRFVTASGIAAIVIALGPLAVMAIPNLTLQKTYPLMAIWCFVPVAWGIWALITPAGWLPERLPIWGAILGLIAGAFGAFVLNLPSRILGIDVPSIGRGAAVIVMAGFYYLLWMLVRAAYTNLVPKPGTTAHEG